jgi:hypothetical protein
VRKGAPKTNLWVRVKSMNLVGICSRYCQTCLFVWCLTCLFVWCLGGQGSNKMSVNTYNWINIAGGHSQEVILCSNLAHMAHVWVPAEGQAAGYFRWNLIKKEDMEGASVFFNKEAIKGG